MYVAEKLNKGDSSACLMQQQPFCYASGFPKEANKVSDHLTVASVPKILYCSWILEFCELPSDISFVFVHLFL